MDRIDRYYFSVSTRINLKEETRIKATSDEAAQWVEDSKSKGKCFINLNGSYAILILCSTLLIHRIQCYVFLHDYLSRPAQLHFRHLLSLQRAGALWIYTHDPDIRGLWEDSR